MRLPIIFIGFSFILYGDDVARFGDEGSTVAEKAVAILFLQYLFAIGLPLVYSQKLSAHIGGIKLFTSPERHCRTT